MGADGPGLFADDTACDVRDAYREALAVGPDDAEAERAVLREFAEERMHLMRVVGYLNSRDQLRTGSSPS